jgi:hypothetical protein
MPRRKTPIFWYLLVMVCVSIFIFPSTLIAGKSKSSSSQGKYWDTVPEEDD